MPWKEIKPMDQKVQLIADWQSKYLSITDLSQKYGISRKTTYKWVKRYQQDGIDGLKDHIRAPLGCPHKTSDEIIGLIIAQKLKNHKRGPKKIFSILRTKHPDIDLPAVSTIGYWLNKNGLVTPRKRHHRVPPYSEPFVECQSPNSVWSADYKGQFYMKNKHVCYPLTISDNYSRYLLKCHGLPGPRYNETRDIFKRAFEEYGLPDAILTDNGTPFAGKCIGGLSRLSIWWIQLGIVPERIEKGCPQQNGRHERMHRTLKEEALDPVALNIKEQQKQFDLFRIEYNQYRPHEALNQQMPINYYQKSLKPYVEKPSNPYYDYSFIVRYVRHNGEIKFKGNRFFVSELLRSQPIGLKQISDHQWRLYFSFYPIGILDIKKNNIVQNV